VVADAMTQDAEIWDRLQVLFHLAEATPEEERERVLQANCSDPELLRRVRAIFNGAHADAAPALIRTWDSSFAGNKIGPYNILRHLGTGGLGSVYLVERLIGGAIQRSALKMMAPHAVGSAFLERFHREQHILASLEHPNITRMLDAGMSAEDQPYLVMEFVNGVHLDLFCDQMSLGIRERLKLFLQVCDAVAYAHRNLIVHLDLKPSNILVTPDGTVKLLDFGTSKLIQPDSLLTTTVAATPAYASPEQLRNDAVTTSCDIYSLGAVLYELLSGSRPNSNASLAIMIERAMNEQEPAGMVHAVSIPAATNRRMTENQLRMTLRSDLSNIVGRCLRARTADRYPSIDALMADIERYLDGRPVLARPQTTLYRMGKFVRRNRKAVAAVLVMNLAILGSIAYGGWRQHQVVLEGQRALRMQNFLYRLFKLANSNYTGKPAATVPEFLQLGVRILPDYIKNPADLREAQMGLAESMVENGDLANAQEVFTRTMAAAKSAGDINAEAESEAFAGNIAYQLGQMSVGQNLTQHALELSRRSAVTPAVRVWSEIFFAANRENNGFRSDENVKLLQSAIQESRERHLPDRETAYALYMLASDYEERGRLDEAESLINESIAIYNQEPYAICDQSEMYADIAYIKGARGDVAASLPLYQKAYQGYKACSGPDNKSTLVVEDFMAGAMIKLGQSKAVVPMLEDALPKWRKIAGSSPELANPLYFLASAYVDTGDYVHGAKTAEELVEVQQGKVAAEDHRMGSSHLVWARALAGEGHYREALPHAEIADTVLTKTANTPGQRLEKDKAHQLLLDLQSKIASGSNS
jgi:serine/threonine protein kinase